MRDRESAKTQLIFELLKKNLKEYLPIKTKTTRNFRSNYFCKIMKLLYCINKVF